MKVVIAGGVAAGMSAASKIKKIDKNAEIIVFEQSEHISYGACGLPFYVSGENESWEKMIARTPEDFAKQGIQVKTNHKAIALDTKLKKLTVKNALTGEVFDESYDKLMVATGAGVITPKIPGVELENVFALKTLTDGLLLREKITSKDIKNVVVIGGGYIGAEVVDAMKLIGKNVRCLEASSSILAPFDKEISDVAVEEIAKNGVSLHVSETVTKLRGDSSVREVVTDKGVYAADAVIIAIGVRPSTDFLKDSGVELASNGAVVVNKEMCSSDPDVYSAGDCAYIYNKILDENFYSPLGTVANKCGRIAGENMMGGNVSYVGALGSAAIKIFSLEMARTGMSEKDCARLCPDYKTTVVTVNDHPLYYPNPTPILIKLMYNGATKEILGAQGVGKKGVVLRIDMFAIAIHAKITTDQLGMVDLCYAPPFAGVWDAIQIACQQAK